MNTWDKPSERNWLTFNDEAWMTESKVFTVPEELREVQKQPESQTPMKKWVSKARSLPKIRRDRVEELKKQIQNGTYFSKDKLILGLKRALDDKLPIQDVDDE